MRRGSSALNALLSVCLLASVTLRRITQTLGTRIRPSTSKKTKSQAVSAVTRQRAPCEEARVAILLKKLLLHVDEPKRGI